MPFHELNGIGKSRRSRVKLIKYVAKYLVESVKKVLLSSILNMPLNDNGREGKHRTR
jgi:hypothetical protein